MGPDWVLKGEMTEECYALYPTLLLCLIYLWDWPITPWLALWKVGLNAAAAKTS